MAAPLNEDFELTNTTRSSPWVKGADILEALRDSKTGALRGVRALASARGGAPSHQFEITLEGTYDPDSVENNGTGTFAISSEGRGRAAMVITVDSSNADVNGNSSEFPVHENVYYRLSNRFGLTESGALGAGETAAVRITT